MKNKHKILIVDDKEENLIALEKILEGVPARFFPALSGKEVLALTLEHDFALAPIDVQMPGVDGFETVALLCSNNNTRHLPVIFIKAILTETKYHLNSILDSLSSVQRLKADESRFLDMSMTRLNHMIDEVINHDN